jgi:NADPH-dependent 2,4-dienoyl-CoA reductase/sulfur reductase-like enzyme
VIRQEEKTPVPCGIPYIFGTLGSPHLNLMPDPLLERHRVEVIVDAVRGIHRDERAVSTADGRRIRYRKLVLTTGSTPLVPDLPGVESEHVFPIHKDVARLERLQEALGRAREVVIIGGGFIGLEMADECRKLGGLGVTVVEMLPRCLIGALEGDLCAGAEQALAETGVRILTGRTARAIVPPDPGGNGHGGHVELDDGERLPADVVILGIGVRPNTELARNAGLVVDPVHGIEVDRHMTTSDPDILAAGDCVQKECLLTDRPLAARLASTAATEARIAGANLFEARRVNPGTVAVFSTRIAGYACGSAGMRESDAEQADLGHIVGAAETPDKHPGALPDAHPLRVKLVFGGPSPMIVGGHVAGGESTGELINVIASMIQARLTVDQVATFQMGTHPLLTSSPVVYPLVMAAEDALTAASVR